MSQLISWRGELLNAQGEISGSATITGSTSIDPENISYSGRLELYTGETFTIETDHGRNVLLTEVDTELYPDCGDRLQRKSNLKEHPIPRAHQTEKKLSILADSDSSARAPLDAAPDTISADNTVIDVMVVYTDDTETAVGSVNDVETMAAAAIASTNTAYT
ncbi:MAG: hypothetical protein PHC51_13600, partial [bacterium]|nr:hypothetical protein [bacterium]